MSITSFMLLITISVNGTLSRFLAVDFEKNDNSTSVTFSTAFFLITGITVVLLPLSFAFTMYADSFLSIPLKVLSDAKWMLLLVFMAFFINAFSAVFNSIAYVKNRTDLSNISVIISRVLTLVVLIIFFSSGFVRIDVYGIAVLISTIIGTAYSIYVFRRLAPEINIAFRYFDLNQLKRIGKLGFWLIISQVGVVLFLQTDILIVNHIKGAEQSGILATLLQWSFLTRILTSIVSGAIGPIILNLYAKKEFEKLKQLTIFSTKIIGLIATSIVCVLIYFSYDLLYIWIGKEYAEYHLVFVIILSHLGFNLSVNAISNLHLAYNKARIPSLVTLLTGLLNIVLSIVLLKYTHLGLYGIAIAGLIALSIKNFLFTPYYSARLMGEPTKTFFKPIFPSVFITLGVLILSYVIPSSYLNIGSNIFLFILYISIFSIILGLLIYKFVLTSHDRQRLMSLAKSKSVA